jgi:hypothetical protein
MTQRFVVQDLACLGVWHPSRHVSRHVMLLLPHAVPCRFLFFRKQWASFFSLTGVTHTLDTLHTPFILSLDSLVPSHLLVL